MKRRITISDNIVWRRIEDEIAILMNDSPSLHILNKTAAYIWEMYNGDYEPDEIATSLCERFEVTFEEAIADVYDLFSKMKELGILEQEEPESVNR